MKLVGKQLRVTMESLIFYFSAMNYLFDNVDHAFELIEGQRRRDDDEEEELDEDQRPSSAENRVNEEAEEEEAEDFISRMSRFFY